uniref:Uncharacterized protein n=1 Tax=Anopheles stephensi TaxID=30069 RepID=A0A182YRK9_ANOST
MSKDPRSGEPRVVEDTDHSDHPGNVEEGLGGDRLGPYHAALAVTLYAEQITTVKSSCGTLVAFFGFPEAVVQKRHVVGFSRCCRMKKMEVKRQCYRCYEYGHIASHCHGKDRSSRCHRCEDTKAHRIVRQGAEMPQLQGPGSNRTLVWTAPVPPSRGCSNFTA